MKASGSMGIKIYTNELGHMTNMAAMPIWIVRLRTLAKVTNLKLTAVSMRVLMGETRE